ncbi:AzlC family protein [Salinisphaera sp. PC39]
MLVVVPMLPGTVPFGMVAGLTAVDAGLSAAQAMTMSLIIFAGAAQLATLQLIAESAVSAVILLTALTINLRLAMYSASLAPHWQHLGRGWQASLAFLLADPNYAVTIQRYRMNDADWRERGHWYFLGSGITLWLTWQAATAVGVFMAARVPGNWHLDFSIPLVFMALLVPVLANRAHALAALTGGTVATLAAGMPFNLGIVTGTFAGIAVGRFAARRRTGG